MREHEVLLERAVQEARLEGEPVGASSEDNSEVSTLREKVIQMAADIEQGELEFSKHLESMQQQHENQISEYSSAA